MSLIFNNINFRGQSIKKFFINPFSFKINNLFFTESERKKMINNDLIYMQSTVNINLINFEVKFGHKKYALKSSLTCFQGIKYMTLSTNKFNDQIFTLLLAIPIES